VSTGRFKNGSDTDMGLFMQPLRADPCFKGCSKASAKGAGWRPCGRVGDSAWKKPHLSGAQRPGPALDVRGVTSAEPARAGGELSSVAAHQAASQGTQAEGGAAANRRARSRWRIRPKPALCEQVGRWVVDRGVGGLGHGPVPAAAVKSTGRS